MIKAKQNACLHRRCLCAEIIRNKFFSNCNHSCFIHIVSFELELTSYSHIHCNPSFLSIPLSDVQSYCMGIIMHV
jgi:hypothetical protein